MAQIDRISGKGTYMDDFRIIELFFARNERAIEETDKKYGRMLTGISFNIVGDRLDAEECVNDTYLAAWNNIPPTRPSDYSAYLCRILRNISYDMYDRKNAIKRKAVMVELSDEIGELVSFRNPDAPAIEDQAAAAEIGKIINLFLKSLKPETAKIFVRRYFYADTIQAISEITGMSTGKIESALFRARKKLKSLLEKEGFYL